MTEAITFLIGFVLGYGIASILFVGKKFVIKINEKGQTILEPINKPKQKMEFMRDMTQEELEEAEKSTVMQTFLGRFAKPAKKEEEEDEI